MATKLAIPGALPRSTTPGRPASSASALGSSRQPSRGLAPTASSLMAPPSNSHLRPSRRLSAQRFRTKEDLDIEGLDTFPTRSGLVSDFMERCKHSRKHKDATTRFFINLLSSRVIGDQAQEHAAARIVACERLKDTLRQAIVADRKHYGIYPPAKKDLLKRWCEQVRSSKRLVGCLRVEVENKRMTHKLLSGHVHQLAETYGDRKHRLDEFWATYQSRSLRTDTQLAPLRSAAAAQDDRPMSSAWHSFPQSKASSRLASRRSSAADGGKALSGAELLKPSVTGKSPLLGSRPDAGTCLSPAAPFARPGTGRTRATATSSLSHAGMSATGMASTGMSKVSSLPSLRPGSFSATQPGPWRMSSTGAALSTVELPAIDAIRHRYLNECSLRRNVPTPLAFATGHSTKFVAAGRDFVDQELLAMVSMLQEMQSIEEVNLHNSMMLTDRSVGPFLRQLLRQPASESLKKFDIGLCTRVGVKTQELCMQMLHSLNNLCHLNLSQVQLATRLQAPICEAIGNHPQLDSVNLSDTGLGGATHITKECITSLLASKTVKTMDLGWNCFAADVFSSLGAGLVTNTCLRSLCIDNCSAAVKERDTPIALFFEHLACNTSLQRLSAAMNRIDFRAALVIEDSLDSHRRLAELSLAQNPLGVLGMRSILRLLSRDWTGLVHFDMENCYTGTPSFDEDLDTDGSHGGIGGVQPAHRTGGKPLHPEPGDSLAFHAANPGGKYVLNLSRPYHRSLLRMLYKTCERFSLQPERAFLGISFCSQAQPSKASTRLPYSHPPKESGIWQVPTSGLLTATFNIQDALEASVKGIDESDFSAVLARHYEVMRFRPGFRKVIPLFARWSELEGRESEQQVFLQALAKDFSLTLPYLEYMCRTFGPSAMHVVWRLLPTVPLGHASCYLGMMALPSLPNYIWVRQQCQALIEFNVENPTGHYKLDLGNCASYAVAERLLLLDRWEAAIDLRHQRFDTSSTGNRSHVRNETYQGRPLRWRFESIAEWALPEADELECDYISNQRPPADAEVLSNELWETLLVEVYHSTCRPEDRIAVLRSVSHHFYLTSGQMRLLIGYFRTPEQRAEAFIIFYLRIIDMYNAKLFRVRFESHEEIVKLQERLGYASFFPFLQPENCRFELDLSFYDQRLCASMYVALAHKEKQTNIRNPQWVRPDGKVDPLPLGVPRSWEDFSKTPKEGLFKGTYACAPEDRNFEFRKKIAQTYGQFQVSVKEQDVLWWTGLMEPPSDVLDFLEFLISRVSHVNEAFTLIDGVDGNGVITLREFEDGIKAIKCHKFKGKDEQLRIGNLFRYLDMGGEGSISLDEWQLLDQLWREFDLSIREFVQFLMLTCGEDLADAWDMLDSDGSGEISEEEWSEACIRIGYFGPCLVVFALIDSSDDGNISFDEFEVLEKYKPGS